MIRHILSDIEGTTTAMAFVHRTLFPYAASALEGFLARHADEPDVAEWLVLLGRDDLLAGTAR